MNLPLLKKLSEASGVPGREERVRQILQRETEGLFDEVETDPMGNLIATKKATDENQPSPRLKNLIILLAVAWLLGTESLSNHTEISQGIGIKP